MLFTNQPLQLLHMGLFGPYKTKLFGGNLYAFVVMDATLSIHGHNSYLRKDSRLVPFGNLSCYPERERIKHCIDL